MLSKPCSPPLIITEERFTRSENDVPFHKRINPFCCAINILVLPFAGLAFGGIAISMGPERPVVIV
jgi:hypothetical protein